MATVAARKKKRASGKGRPVSNSAISQPALENSSSVDTLSAFSPSGDLFAFVSLAVDKHRLRVHDTATGTSVSEYIVDSARVTSLSWAQFQNPKSLSEGQEPEESAPRKRRKKRDAPTLPPHTEPEPIPVIVLGLSTGSVILFSPSHARVIRTLSHPSSTSSSLSLDVYTRVADAALIILASSADCFILTWNAQTGELLSKNKTDERSPGTSLSLLPTVEPDRPSLLLAHHSIRLLTNSSDSLLTSPQKFTEESRFIGHASNVTMLRWQPSESEGQPPRRFASIAEADRYVHLWEVPHDLGSEGKLVASAPLDSDARHISFSKSPIHPRLLVLSASGRISIFSPTTNSAGATTPKTKEKVATLSPRSSATISFRRGGNRSANVVNATFEHEGRIRVAWLAGGVKPVFDVLVSFCVLRSPILVKDDALCPPHSNISTILEISFRTSILFMKSRVPVWLMERTPRQYVISACIHLALIAVLSRSLPIGDIRSLRPLPFEAVQKSPKTRLLMVWSTLRAT